MGQSPRGAMYTDNPNDAILVQGNADLEDGWVRPRVWTKEITKTANVGDLILSVRAPVGEVGKTSFDVVLGRGVAGIKGSEFIFQALANLKRISYWSRVSTGSTFESINGTDLYTTPISQPTSKAEQQQIGGFFQQFDTLITLHQRKRNGLKSD